MSDEIVSNGNGDNPYNRLRDVRTQRNMSQSFVAAHLDLASVTVSRHENGSRGIDRKTIEAYATIYKCDPYELFVDLN